jgi:hypothetical protein
LKEAEEYKVLGRERRSGSCLVLGGTETVGKKKKKKEKRCKRGLSGPV